MSSAIDRRPAPMRRTQSLFTDAYPIQSAIIEENVTKDDQMLPKSFIWDWPLSSDGVAKCLATNEKFTVSLEFTSGGEFYDQTTFKAKKVDAFKESMSSWSLGLSSMNNGSTHASFWRLEIDILPNLNMLAIEAFRDISHHSDKGKVLRRIRKVYRLPDEFDITTLTTTSSIYGVIILEALRRTKSSAQQQRSVSIVKY